METTEFNKIDKDQLIRDIVNQLVDTVDMKTLIAAYYDGQVGYMSSMDKDELLEYANDYLNLSGSELIDEYINE